MARVLLVEDEVSVLILAESIVQGLGYQTLSAASMTEALNLFENVGPVSALFTDIRLPEGDLAGLELAQKAKPFTESALHNRADGHGRDEIHVRGGQPFPHKALHGQ